MGAEAQLSRYTGSGSERTGWLKLSEFELEIPRSLEFGVGRLGLGIDVGALWGHPSQPKSDSHRNNWEKV